MCGMCTADEGTFTVSCCSNLPGKGVAVKDSLMSVTVLSSASSVSDFSPQSCKRRKLLFVRSDLLNETNVWLRVYFNRLLLVAFYSYAQALSRKKTVMVFFLSTGGSYHYLSWSCCSQDTQLMCPLLQFCMCLFPCSLKD